MSAVSCTHAVFDLLRALKQQNVFYETTVDPKITLKSITIHHGKGQSPGLFVPLKGDATDGHVYLHEYLQAHPQNVVLCGAYFKSNVSNQDRSRVVFVQDPLVALQQWAMAYRKGLAVDVVAVTGSSGKTTFKDILISLLGQKLSVMGTSGNLNNHIGVPLTVLSLSKGTQVAVFELGMNHPGEIAQLAAIAQPTMGAILNVGQAHVGHLGSVENVAKAKGELAQVVTTVGGRTYGLTPYRRWFDSQLSQQITWIEPTTLPSAWTFLSSWQLQFKKENIDLAKVGVGQETLALALAIAHAFELTPEQCWQGIKLFSQQERGLRGSLKSVGVHWVFLDCYNANPDSFQFSLKRACYLAHQVPAAGFIGWYGDMGELGAHSLELHRATLELLAQTKCPQPEVQRYFLGSWFKKAFESSDVSRKQSSSFHFLDGIPQAKKILATLFAQPTPQFFHVKASRASRLEKLFEPYLSVEALSPMVK